MKFTKLLTGASLLVGLALSMSLLGCGGSETGADPAAPFVRDATLDVMLKSKKGAATSHLVGSQCMECHQAKGNGPGLFTAAGTITDKNGKVMPGALVRLTSEDPDKVMGGGKVYVEIEVDDLGNFYTTEALPMPDPGAVPSVVSANTGKFVSMNFPSESGACNFCHTQASGGRTGFKKLE